jgi:hypothetical protein
LSQVDPTREQVFSIGNGDAGGLRQRTERKRSSQQKEKQASIHKITSQVVLYYRQFIIYPPARFCQCGTCWNSVVAARAPPTFCCRVDPKTV